MAGQIKRVIDVIITKSSNGNNAIANFTKTKLLLKGINPDKFDSNSADDPSILAKLQMFANELNINV